MDYGKIVSRSWTIVWENKWLLVLGFLAALGGGGGGSSSNFNTGSGGGNDFSLDGAPDISGFWDDYGIIIMAAVCFLFILSIVLWVLKLVGEAGMIASVDKIEDGEKMNLSKGFSAGTSFLPRMLGLSLLLAAPTMIVGFLFFAIGLGVYLAAPSGLEESFGIAMLCFIPVVCLLAIYAFVVQFIYPFAQRGIILDGFGVVDGIKHGWRVLNDNFSEIIILAIIFLVIGFAIGIVSAIVIVPIVLISLVPVIISMANGGAISAITVVFAVLGVIVTIILGAAIGSIQRALQSTAFTLGYREWTGKHKMENVAPLT